MEGNEVELKLALDPGGIARLKRSAIVRDNKQGRPASRLLSSTYYDTPAFTLAKAGITVRMRRSGNAWLQTVKTAGSRTSGLFDRREWEEDVGGEALDLARLRATKLSPLCDDAVLRALAPVFATQVRRTLYRLAAEDWEVELAFDQGTVDVGAASQPICEAELELKAGAPARLYALAQALTEVAPTRLMAVSKSERGYELAAGTRPKPVKARPVPLVADMPVGEALQAIARNCLQQVLANERCLLDTRDPEAIHQMRVALRRLRSALKVFAKLVEGPHLTRSKQEVRWLLDHLGPARDADVFMAEILDPVVAADRGNAGLAALQAWWRERRDEDFARALCAVADSRFTTLLLDLGAWVEAGDWLQIPRPLRPEPVGAFSRKVLAKRYRKLMNAGGKNPARLSPEALHTVRILGKQLRYAGEFFASLYPKGATRDFLGTMAELQDLLGELNDIEVAGQRLAGSGHGEHAWAAGLLVGWHDGRRSTLLAEAGATWRRLRKLDRFWD